VSGLALGLLVLPLRVDSRALLRIALLLQDTLMLLLLALLGTAVWGVKFDCTRGAGA